jgi:hypothetical protein
MRGHRLEYPQGTQRQSIVGGWHVKFSLTVGQRVSLFAIVSAIVAAIQFSLLD